MVGRSTLPKVDVGEMAATLLDQGEGHTAQQGSDQDWAKNIGGSAEKLMIQWPEVPYSRGVSCDDNK